MFLDNDNQELKKQVCDDFVKAKEKRHKYILAFKSENGYVIANAGAKFEKINRAILCFGEKKTVLEDGQIISGHDFVLVARPSKLISAAIVENEAETYFRIKVDQDKERNLDSKFWALIETETMSYFLSFDTETQIISTFSVTEEEPGDKSHKAFYNSLTTLLENKEATDNG